jgi:hypothetical protein
MKESHGEGVASHTGSESCTAHREVRCEALTGVRAGRVLNRETDTPPQGGHFGVPTLLSASGRPHRRRRYRETSLNPARSKTPGTRGYILDGNREILGVSASRGHAGRIGKSQDARR